MKVFAFNPILEELFGTPPTNPQSSRVTNFLEIEGNPKKTGSPLMSSSVCKKIHQNDKFAMVAMIMIMTMMQVMTMAITLTE